LKAIDIQKLVLNALEITACVTGFLNWKKIRSSYWKFFPVYLAIIIIAEFIGKYLKYMGLARANLGLYNYFVIPLEMLFFTWLFHKAFTQTIFRRLPTAAACIYIACWLADTFVIPKGSYTWISSFSYTAGNVLLLVLILTALYKLAAGNDIIFIKTNMVFWVCMGLLVFYLFSLPFYGMGNYLYNRYRNIYTSYAHIIYILNYIMYILFTIAFIWGKPKSSFS
jgi:hypothetical protein